MKIAVIGDIHAIAPNDPHVAFHADRTFFKDAWPSFLSLCKEMQAAAPDLVISLGDLVDWYSDENRDFVVEHLNQLPCPWLFTPGNHDLEFPIHPFTRWATTREKGAEIQRKWEEAGFDFGNQHLDAGDTGIFLINSAFSRVASGTRDWLLTRLPQKARNIIFTHVPFDLPEVREYILGVSPGRDMQKYVQSGSPGFLDATMRNQVEHVFNGHLHFTGSIHTSSTVHHLAGMGIAPVSRSANRGRFHLLTLGKDIGIDTICVSTQVP